MQSPIIPICIVSSQAEDCLPTASAGSLANAPKRANTSSCRFRFSALASVDSSARPCSRPSSRDNSPSSAIWPGSLTRQPSAAGCTSPPTGAGSSTPNGPSAEGCRVREPGQIAEEGELSLLEGLEQGLAEESTEASAENLNRQEEVFALFGALARDPALAVGRQSSAWDDTMQMGMMGELLAPGVQDGEEAELGTQVFGIGGDRVQSGGHGLE